MMIREPVVAGMFYPGSQDQCLAELKACLERAAQKPSPIEPAGEGREIVGGIVPHAGWICSGAVAGRVFGEIAARRQPAVVVIFGAVHVMTGPRAPLFPSGAWSTPLGLAHVDERLSERLHNQTNLLEDAPHAHEREHSIEVQLPFIQHLMPDALIVPIMVPVNDKAATLGAAVGSACKSYDVDVLFIGSTDLTHYGPSYHFATHGVGLEGLTWAKDVNDRRMIDLILAMREEKVVEDAVTNRSACGGGAIAATVAACRAAGAKRATLLEHTTSYEVLSEYRGESPRDSVGYAGILFD
jgi:AmmeMemoRadiSam system protein B